MFDNSTSAVKQRHIEEVCKGELDSETVGRVLQWGADLVKYYRLLEPGILVTVSGHLRLSIQVTPCQVHPGVVFPVTRFFPGVSRLQGRLLFCLAKARVHQMREQGGPQVRKCFETERRNVNHSGGR